MVKPSKSILVVTADSAISDAIAGALADDAGVQIDTQASTLAQMNGTAVRMVSKYDIVLFQTSPDDDADLQAIRTLAANRREGTTLVAIADGNISLSQARALNNAGVDEVLPISGLAQEMGDQVSKIDRTNAAVSAETRPLGKIIAVAQARGGVGSTTVAVNLADQLAGHVKERRGVVKAKVALVDFDLQFGTIGSFLDLQEQDTLLQLALDGTIPDATFLSQSMTKMPNGLVVLAAPSKFAPLDSLRIDQVAAILETLQLSHDYVIVDMPRALVGWVEAIVQRANELIIVTDISVSSVRHCRRLIEFFTADNVTLPVKVVVNGERKPLLQKLVHREAAKALDRKFDHWLPRDSNAANNAADRGQPLSTTAPRSVLTKAFGQMANSTKNDLPKMPLGNRN